MGINWTAIDHFIRQPTTILGIAGLVGTGVSLATHELTWAAAVPLMAGSAVAIAVPQKPAVAQDVQQAVTDGIAAVQKPGVASGGIITADLIKLAGDLPDGTPVVPVKPATPVVAPTYVVDAAPVVAAAVATAVGMKLPSA